MANNFVEYVIQPRTGSQGIAAGNANKEFYSTNQSDYLAQKQQSWDAEDTRYARVTLGLKSTDTYPGSADDAGVNLCKQQTPNQKIWAWGGSMINGHKVTACIRPVPELCAIQSWNGINYNPSEWKVMPELMDSIDRTNTVFLTDCVDNSSLCSDNVDGCNGGEHSELNSGCIVACSIDPTKFNTLKSVQEYEQKYGKYTTDIDACFVGNNRKTIFSCMSDTAVNGNAIFNPEYPFRPGYEAVMTNFCAQKSNNCPIDPATGKYASVCSNLMSSGDEGSVCRLWYHTYGPYKSRIATKIGDIYCKENPAAYDCACYSRNDPKNPNYYTLQNIQNSMKASGIVIPDPCFYLPCADSTHYIIGDEDFGIPSNSDTYYDKNYGFTCADTVCANITNNQSLNEQMSGNNAFIQCAPTNDNDNHGNDDNNNNNNNNNNGGNNPITSITTASTNHKMKAIGYGSGALILLLILIVVLILGIKTALKN